MDMRRQIICLLVCALFLAGPVLAARNWTTEESTASTLLNGVFFSTLNSGRVVGDGGVIRVTSDKGHNWAAEVSGTTDNLSGLFLASSTEGWAVGAALRTVHLSNGSWTSAKIVHSSDIDLTGVCMTGTSTIFASAGPNLASGNPADFRNIFYSRDGGVTWSSKNISNSNDPATSSNPMQAVFFVNSQLGFICGQNDDSLAGKIFRTTDEGTTWTDVSPTAPDIGFNDIRFISTLEGWAVGTKTGTPRTAYVYHTADGGDTWLSQISGGVSPAGFRRISTVTSTDAWAASDQGQVYRFDGANWTQELEVPVPGYFTSIFFIDPSNGWAVGGARAAEGGPQRLIYKYVVDPNNLRVDKTVYISGVSTEVTTTNLTVSGVNIQPDSQLTVEARSGLVIASYAPVLSSLSNVYIINASITVNPASAEAGKFSFFVTNPSENTGGTAEVTVVRSASPVEKPVVVPVAEGIFNPAVQNSVNMQVATPGQLTVSTAAVKKNFPKVSGTWASVADVDLELILYNFNNHQIAYRKKFTADPSGYTTVTLQKVNDLGLNIGEGMYTAVVIHPRFGQIGSGVLVVNYH